MINLKINYERLSLRIPESYLQNVCFVSFPPSRTVRHEGDTHSLDSLTSISLVLFCLVLSLLLIVSYFSHCVCVWLTSSVTHSKRERIVQYKQKLTECVDFRTLQSEGLRWMLCRCFYLHPAWQFILWQIDFLVKHGERFFKNSLLHVLIAYKSHNCVLFYSRTVLFLFD
jgi:hypothetical protein